MKAWILLTLMALPVQANFAQNDKQLVYLPMGDSYTICEGLPVKQRWPNILTRHLNEKGYRVTLADNPARTGNTTEDVIKSQLPLINKVNPDIVTLLIGVNDYVQGKTIEYFSDQLSLILDGLQKDMKAPKQLVLITIPDFSVTAGGKKYASGRNVTEDLKLWNEVIIKQATQRNLRYADIFELSRDMGTNRALVGADKLHPSAKEVALWEKLILKAVIDVLEVD